MSNELDEDTITLSLGLVALNWLRLYLPLVGAGLPQMPNNAGPDGLGFAGKGFRALLAGMVPRLDLRVGARFAGAPALAVHAALQESADTIAKMPATFMTYPNGGPVFPTTRRAVRQIGGDVVLDTDFLARFGTLEVPRNLWRALGWFAVWVEPELIAEWVRLMRGYADRQERKWDEGVLGATMTWSEQKRETGLPRERAIALMQAGPVMPCVWSGRRLEVATLDIDHCLPWTAWPCGDPDAGPLSGEPT